ncbi:MAG TPA: phospholipase D-like domain-containing protein [Methylocystis sp.]|nr:phospholipase D-like domain-containing protein [Methylocystis sp.]
MRLMLAAAVAAVALAPKPPASGLLATEPSVAGVRAYYAPTAGVGGIDPRLIDAALSSIDMAAYVLTDRPIVEALGRAAMRGVRLRIYLDGEQMSRAHESVARLAATPNVELRSKRRSLDAMHLKSFVVDRRVLRSGSANFSVSGEDYQDNDLLVIDSPELAARFEENFERMWTRADNQRIGVR